MESHYLSRVELSNTDINFSGLLYFQHKKTKPPNKIKEATKLYYGANFKMMV